MWRFCINNKIVGQFVVAGLEDQSDIPITFGLIHILNVGQLELIF